MAMNIISRIQQLAAAPVAVRDAPQLAENCWTCPTPKGPKGRFDAAAPFFWGIWNFSPNKPAAKSQLAYLCQCGFALDHRRVPLCLSSAVAAACCPSG
jgi:hypothetical protein